MRLRSARLYRQAIFQGFHHGVEIMIIFPRSNGEMGSTVTEQHVTHILVVDDDRSIRETLRVVLQEEGYTVSEAEDGKVALRILQASKEPMVVLLDLRMPVLDGAGVLAFVAEDQRLSSLHAFLLITANRDTINDKTDGGKTERLLQQLQVMVIPKPFDLDRLIDIVAATAHRKRTSLPHSWSDTSPHHAARSSNS
jgi:CheY-like chemotaxis protein